MRMTRGWTGLRTAVIALGLLAWSRAPCASRRRHPDSTARRGPSGPPGSPARNVISFVPVQSASVDTASNISLGYFQVAPLGRRPVDDLRQHAVQPDARCPTPSTATRQRRADHGDRLPQRDRERPVSIERAGLVRPDLEPARSRSPDGTGTLGLLERPGVAGPLVGQQRPDDLAGPDHHRHHRPAIGTACPSPAPSRCSSAWWAASACGASCRTVGSGPRPDPIRADSTSTSTPPASPRRGLPRGLECLCRRPTWWGVPSFMVSSPAALLVSSSLSHHAAPSGLSVASSRCTRRSRASVRRSLACGGIVASRRFIPS